MNNVSVEGVALDRRDRDATRLTPLTPEGPSQDGCGGERAVRAVRGVVGLVTPRYAPAIGGVERHVEMLARGLARRGIDVEVVTADPDGGLPAVEERDGVVVRRFPTLGRDAVYLLAPQLGWWLLRNARRFAILHAHSYHAPLALQAALAARRAVVPFVLTPHYHGTGHSPFRRVLHIPYRPIGGWLVSQARRVVCVSQTEQALLHRHFGQHLPSIVAPNGIELDEVRAAQPREKSAGRVLVLAVGRLEAYKQTERLVAALAHLPPEYAAAIVGDGPARTDLEQLALRSAARARLRLLGQVTRQELLGWYRTADVFVSASRREAFGLTLLEAAQGGARVIASDIPAHREVAGYLPAGRVSFVSPDCSPAELARAVEESLRRERPEAVQIERLPTWERMIDDVLECYRAVLEERLAGAARAEHA